jgi:translation initiation factor 1
LDIIFERKGRGGKTATIITGFTVSDDQVSDIAARLKRKLGAGGSARGGEILIQGDRRNDVLKLLTDMGLKARII